MPKRILFVVPYVPNLIRVRPYNLIRYLAQRGNQVTVLTLWSNEPERETLKSLEPYAERILAVKLPRWRSMWNCLTALPTRKPLQAVFCWEPGLAHLMDTITRQVEDTLPYDAVHVEHLRGAEYGLYLKSAARAGGFSLPVVWDSVDSISLLFRQAMQHSASLFSRAWTRLELGRTEPYEGWLLSQFDWVTVTSPNDQRALLKLLPPEARPPKISVLPNGVDLEYFKPEPDVVHDPASLIISGKMSYHANVTMVLNFMANIMPRVWAQQPQVRLYIVGKDPGREILALADNPQVSVTGTVKDLPPYLQKATLAVAPIAYGAGIQNKVLEAMACATPVITSPQAVSALQVTPGQDLLVANNPQAFACAILDLLADPERRHKIGQAGRRYVEENHNWMVVATQLEQIYSNAQAEVNAPK